MRFHYVFRLGVAMFAGLMLSTPPVRASEVLVNPGFELGQTVFGWYTYGAISSNVLSQTSASIAHFGSNYLKVCQGFNGSVNYSGVYQDNISGPGAVFGADGWAYTSAADALAAIAALVLADLDRLFAAALCAAAMSIDAFRGTDAFLDGRVHTIRGQAGPSVVAAVLAGLIEGSQIIPSHLHNDPRVQHTV